jgi:hypothetical protein
MNLQEELKSKDDMIDEIVNSLDDYSRNALLTIAKEYCRWKLKITPIDKITVFYNKVKDPSKKYALIKDEPEAAETIKKKKCKECGLVNEHKMSCTHSNKTQLRFNATIKQS